MEEKAIVEKFPIWVILLTIVLSFFGSGTTWFFQEGLSNLFDWGSMGYIMSYTAGPLLAYFLLTLVTMATKKKFSTNTIAYLYTTVAVSSVLGMTLFPYRNFWENILGARYVDRYGLAAKHMPPWWMISKNAARAFMEPGPVNPEWGPVILYWWVYGLAVYFLLVGLSIFVRHQWYDVENLTYPYVQIALETSRSIENPSRPQTKKILIGTVLGIIYFFPWVMKWFFPWFPDIYGRAVHDDYYSLRLDLAFPAIFRSAVGVTNLCYSPLYVTLAYFMPLNTLFSAAFFYVVYILMGTQIVWYMGYYTGIDKVSSSTRADMLRHQNPINVTGFIEHGLLPATLIMAVILNYRSIIVTPLRLALGTGSQTDKETESKEPISYRNALIMIVACAITVLALLMLSGFPADLALIWVGVTIVLYQMSYARARGYAGPIVVGSRVAPLFYRWRYPNVTIDTEPAGFYLYGVGGPIHTDALSGPALTCLPIFETWRVAQDLGTNKKAMFRVLCTVGVIAPLFSMLGLVVVGSAIGVAHSGIGTPSEPSSGLPSYTYTRPSPPPVWPHITAGFLLAAFLSFMRFRFVWWPLDPIGAFIGLGGPGVKIGLGWAFIIAFVVKYITLKVGGSKLYTETGVPIATGIVAGHLVMGLVAMGIGAAIFVRPV